MDKEPAGNTRLCHLLRDITDHPEKTGPCHNVALMLAQRRSRWANIKTTLDNVLCSLGIDQTEQTRSRQAQQITGWSSTRTEAAIAVYILMVSVNKQITMMKKLSSIAKMVNTCI